VDFPRNGSMMLRARRRPWQDDHAGTTARHSRLKWRRPRLKAKLSVSRQAIVLGINRGSVYYQPRPVPAGDLKLMHRIDKLHMEFPFVSCCRFRGHETGSRPIARVKSKPGFCISAAPPAPGRMIFWAFLATICRIDHLRHCNRLKVRISLERSRLPWRDPFSALWEAGLVGGSLSRTLNEIGLVSTGGEEFAGVFLALSSIDAAIMGRKQGELILRLQRLTRVQDSSVLEYLDSLLDPLRFGLRMSF
jgi:hypothetical protein